MFDRCRTKEADWKFLGSLRGAFYFTRSETRFERKLVASKLFQSSEREKSGVKYPRKGDSVSCSGECQSCAINVRRLNENKDCRRKFEEVTSKSSVTSVGSYGSFIIKSKTQNVKDVNQL